MQRHRRFLISFCGGLAAGALLFRLQAVDRLLIFSVTFCAAYLALTALAMPGITADIMRGRASRDDEGVRIIVPMGVAAVAISLIAILMTIRAPHAGLALRPALALISVPLGWTMIHMVMAFHYASLWYGRGPDRHEARDIAFPGLADGQDAGLWDFVYYSFTLGMTAQTSDAAALSTRMRRVTVIHGACAFFHNTVLLALAVNAAVALG
ncbi:DUF1345 domain-containing protein [Paracoccus sp. (in: a-proteobacteria)]|uniref:DUF1345 domain-containing protein n=1 Tax=Paracoccus sp. TaxID=267 RepID=UPI00321FC4D8